LAQFKLHRSIPGIRDVYHRLDEARRERDGLSAKLGRVAAELAEATRERDGAIRGRNEAVGALKAVTSELDYLRGSDLAHLVETEALLWGDNVKESYFDAAEQDLEHQWSFVDPYLARFPIDYSATLELSCGHGRNSVILGERAANLTLVDVNPENIAFCRQRFAGQPWTIIQNNGYDLRAVPRESITFLFCFEAAVHFDLEVIIRYIKEFHRVLASGALGFVHHSNYTGAPGRDFQEHPAWRNFMSKDIFAHVCRRNGLEIVDQYLIDWNSPAYRNTDCFTVFRRP
jgi:hypothetical protein